MIVRTELDLHQALLLDSETEHVEFKEAKNRYDFEELVGYCCALANEGGGSIILGVTDKAPRRIVGTLAFDQPDRTKIGLFERIRERQKPRNRRIAEALARCGWSNDRVRAWTSCSARVSGEGFARSLSISCASRAAAAVRRRW